MFSIYDLRPMRMDYNLFLRANQGMLPEAELVQAGQPGIAKEAPRTREELLAFARFLGERWLVVNYRWIEEGLRLRLPKVGQILGTADRLALSWERCSWVQLGWDGTVQAQCGVRDEKVLTKLRAGATDGLWEGEMQVTAAVEWAWRAFRAGEVAKAERMVGQLTEAEVFVVPPAISRATRWRKWMLVLIVVFALVSLLFSLLAKKPSPPAGGKPVPVQAAPAP